MNVINRTRSGRRSCVALMLVATLLLATPFSALASGETLKRSVSNMAQGPLDMILSPITTAINMTRKMRDVDDSTGVRIAFAIPGYIWYTGVVMGGGGLRTVTGLLEVLPGVVLLPFEADLDPLFDPVDRAPALVEVETPCCIYIKFGLDYTTAE